MTNILYDALFLPHKDNSSVFLESDDGTSLSYADFIKRAAQIAHVLVSSGVSVGDRVVVQAPKTLDAVALYAATVQAGAVYLPLNNAYTLEEVSYFVGDAQPTVIVCDPKDQEELATLASEHAAKLLTLGGNDGTLSTAANAMPEAFTTIDRAPDDLAALLYTSGTTGRSKGAMLTHKNLLSNAQVLTELWCITEQDRLIHALPIFHTHGLFVALNTSLLAGVTVRLMGKFDVASILTELPTSTVLMGVPTFYTRLLASTEFTSSLTSNMRLFISGSAPLLAETHSNFQERTGHRILERYGMTETNMITSNPYEGERVAGTVGYALAGTEVRITDSETGNTLDSGQIGSIEVRGDNVFKGYWNMPEKTAEELRENGFFITGDLGILDSDGRLSIVGRSKDLIISGGYNIYPKEIEDVLNDIDGIDESAVFGVPHADFGESVIAAIVPSVTELNLDNVREQVSKKLARFKVPQHYVLMTSLPRNTMGKVQKNVLRTDYENVIETG